MSEEVTKRGPKIGLALAGGGPGGAVYEIGALRALEEAVDGLDFSQIDAYVGVSAGAFISASLANGIHTGILARSIVNTVPGEHPFNPELFLMPAFEEYFRSALNMPRLVMDGVRDFLSGAEDRNVFNSLIKLSRALPTGIFNNAPIRKFLERAFHRKDRTDDFRRLDKKLFVVAADLDSGEAVIFGKDGYDAVPISLAVQASTALPGLYPPVLIDGRYYVDGVLLKTLHASTILEEELDLAICINPIVPVDTRKSVEQGIMRRGKLIDRGMPTILSQTFRTLIHSRLETGMANYASRYDKTDLLLFEPKRDDYRMFFTNIFSFAKRKEVCEHAYHQMFAYLRENQVKIGSVLEKHGLTLNQDVLDGERRDLWRNVGVDDNGHGGPRVLSNLDKALGRLEGYVSAQAND